MQVILQNMQLFLKICNYYALMQNKFLKRKIIYEYEYVIIHVFNAELLLFKDAYFVCE